MAEKTPEKIAIERIEENFINQEDNLSLFGLQLDAVPREIRKLSHLKSLDLTGNRLTSLPGEISNLSKLEILLLPSNRFSTFPKELLKLSSLRELVFGNEYSDNNQLVDLPKEINNLKSLRILKLSGNNLSALPNEIGGLNNLEELYLDRNNITKLPVEITNLRKLKILDLSENFLLKPVSETFTIPAEIFTIFSLEVLKIEGNGFATIPHEIAKLDKLRELHISNNNISYIPIELSAALEKLDISRNKKFPENISCLEKLRELRLDAIEINDQLPAQITSLFNLEVLSATSCSLTSIPDTIALLKKLRYLSLVDNKIQKLPDEIGYLNYLEEFHLGNNSLKSIPSSIKSLQNLKQFTVARNQIQYLPSELYELEKLEFLDLRRNLIVSLPDEIKKLTNLKMLYLGDGHVGGISLATLPNALVYLENLEELRASHCNISNLPVGLEQLSNLKRLDLRKNLLLIPPEILEKVDEPEIILNYYYLVTEQKRRPVNEIKLLIIGQGSVGKTSLVEYILYGRFNKNQTKTEGIAINQWLINENQEKQDSPIPLPDFHVKLNLWDFGGQEIMHATHQFFLTKRSLYLLVLDSRLTQEENRVEYWLKIIQSFGGESPVLIVGNKIDQHPLDIDRTGLQKKYPNIVGILETSAATGAGIEALKATITEQVNNLPHVRDLLPETWFTVKTKLEELGKQSNFITQEKYLDLCAENEVTDETSQRTLIGFLHDLGVVLHFQDDPRLEALGILNPQWVTNGVYKILNSHTLFQNKGVLTVSMLNDILHTEDGYPRDKRLFIVDMMKKFELCYDIDGDTFLVPDLLPKDEPYTGEWNGALAFKYAYGVLPSSIMSRFIVKMKDFVHQPSTWRSGTILKKDGNTAFVKADFEDKTVTIKVQGSPNTRRDTLSLIRGAFEMIHKSVARLEVTQQVPHPQYPNLILDYEELIEFEREGVEEFPRKVDGKVIKVNVREMLNGVESESQRREKSVIINNYYNARDGGIIVGRDFSGNLISGNYNKINTAEIDPELKATLLQLGEAVDTMIQKIPAEQAAEVAEDYGKLADEAVKPKPNKKWYSVSIEGLIKAAENLDKLGTPVISLSRKVLSLLTGGMVK